MKVDLNCDLGEGMHNDALLLPLISSANIACGVHAGNDSTMQQTIARCVELGVAVGAHPSWPDREHFGRRDMQLPEQELFDCITGQLHRLQTIAASFHTRLRHVKPHGALYNQSAKDRQIAATIARAVKAFDPSLILFGLSGSYSITEAEKEGLKTASEVFADRTYQDDGSLTPRSQPNSLVEDESAAAAQVLQMICGQQVITVTGKRIPIKADTVCIHGDGAHAFAICNAIVSILTQHAISIEAV